MQTVKKIKSIRSLGIMSVYDVITGSDNRNFVLGNGIVAHNCDSIQPALRNFMEEYSSNCGFILTCNYKQRIIPPLQSRCSVVDFTFSKDEKLAMAGEFIKRMSIILKSEGIEFEKKILAELAMKYLPDWRRMLNELQRYSVTGKIDSGILANSSQANILQLVKMLKNKEFTNVRKWIAANPDMDNASLVRTLYDEAYTHIKPESIPQLVLILGEYQMKAAFVVDQEINNCAMLTEIMGNVELV